MRHADAPLILTLQFDPVTFARLDGLRRAHFPPERNMLSAHLTLFHHLPAERRDDVLVCLRRVTQREPFPVRFSSLRSLGRGVALAAEAPELGIVRAEIAASFADQLTAQDRAGFRPHVTIQNKVMPPQARELLARLAASFSPWEGIATGLLLWRYLGGPWELEADTPFTPDRIRSPR